MRWYLLNSLETSLSSPLHEPLVINRYVSESPSPERRRRSVLYATWSIKAALPPWMWISWLMPYRMRIRIYVSQAHKRNARRHYSIQFYSLVSLVIRRDFVHLRTIYTQSVLLALLSFRQLFKRHFVHERRGSSIHQLCMNCRLFVEEEHLSQGKLAVRLDFRRLCSSSSFYLATCRTGLSDSEKRHENFTVAGVVPSWVNFLSGEVSILYSSEKPACRCCPPSDWLLQLSNRLLSAASIAE